MPASSPPRFGTGAFALTLLVSLAFALNIVAMKVVVDATAPLAAAALRMGVVFLLCAPWLRLPAGRGWALGGYGLLNGGLFLLLMNLALFLATNVGALAIAGQLGTPFAILLAAIFLGERLGLRRIGGVALAFAGVALIVFDPRIAHELPGMLAMIAAASAWGAGTLLQRRLGGVPVLTMQAWNGMIGAALLLPIALWFEAPAFARALHAGAGPIAWFAFSCLGSTLFGQGALAWLLQRFPVGTVMPVLLTSPVFAVAVASIWSGAAITPAMIAGGLVTFAGVAIVSLGNRPPPAAGPAP